MNSREVLGRLQGLGVPAVTTADAAAVLGLTIEAASHSLRRLTQAGLLTAVRKGLWALSSRPDPFHLAEYVTAPFPCYLSLQTALYQRGMITQIPTMIYVVTLGRSGRITTRIGTYSAHHVLPECFGGFETLAGSGIKLALPEKALVDFLYLSSTRSRLFTAMPELELSADFRRAAAREWIRRIPFDRRRTMVTQRLEELLAHTAIDRGSTQE
jgi:predicted transcriptional regulator of viral defense system